MSEKSIQEDMQDTIQAISAFAKADVVINDWRVLDQGVSKAPYVIILNSDVFESRQPTQSKITIWDIPIVLVEEFVNWTDSLVAFRDRRQTLIDEFNEVGSDRRSAGQSATTADLIRNEGPIDYIYDIYNEADLDPEAEPTFITQRMIFRFEEF